MLQTGLRQNDVDAGPRSARDSKPQRWIDIRVAQRLRETPSKSMRGPYSATRSAWKTAHVSIDDLLAEEQVGVPFRLGAFERGSAAKHRQRAEAAERAAADLDDALAVVIQRLPWHCAAHHRLLAQQQLGEANATAVFTRRIAFVRRPRRAAAQQRQSQSDNPPAFERRQRQQMREVLANAFQFDESEKQCGLRRCDGLPE